MATELESAHISVLRSVPRGVSREPLWILHTKRNIKKLEVKVSRIWNLSWNRTPFKLLPQLSNSFRAHMIATLTAIGLNYDFSEKIEIL